MWFAKECFCNDMLRGWCEPHEYNHLLWLLFFVVHLWSISKSRMMQLFSEIHCFSYKWHSEFINNLNSVHSDFSFYSLIWVSTTSGIWWLMLNSVTDFTESLLCNVLALSCQFYMWLQCSQAENNEFIFWLLGGSTASCRHKVDEHKKHLVWVRIRSQFGLKQ